MNFSIVFPSRGRSVLLTNLIKSIAITTNDLSKIEVLVGVDNDDEVTINTLDLLTYRFPFVQWYSRERSGMLNRDYINWLCELSTGKYFIVCNDDAIFRTYDWDQIIIDRLDDYLADKPDGIVYVFLSDGILNRHGLGFCCFPLISRKAALAVGYPMPPQFPSWGSDVLVWRIYQSMNRVCKIPEVMVEHISIHSGLRERDETSMHVQHISQNFNHDPQKLNIKTELQNLAVAIYGHELPRHINYYLDIAATEPAADEPPRLLKKEYFDTLVDEIEKQQIEKQQNEPVHIRVSVSEPAIITYETISSFAS